jgi:hypothetical protein
MRQSLGWQDSNKKPPMGDRNFVLSSTRTFLKHFSFSLAPAVGLATWLFSLSAFAGPFCLPGNLGVSKQAEFFHQIRIIGPENRLTVGEYAKLKGVSAKEISKKFGASGVAACGVGGASAQIVGANDVLVLSGHVFHRTNEGCQLYVDLAEANCRFTPSYGPDAGVAIPMDLSTMVSRCHPTDLHHDWAVVKLVRPVRGVLPYKIAKVAQVPEAGTPILVVASSQTNFERNGKKPMSIEECLVRDTYLDRNIPIQTDCDTGNGSSGAANLVDSTDGVTMIAIHTAGTRGEEPGHPYEKSRVFNYSTPVIGEFHSTIARMAGLKQKTAEGR